MNLLLVFLIGYLVGRMVPDQTWFDILKRGPNGYGAYGTARQQYRGWMRSLFWNSPLGSLVIQFHYRFIRKKRD